MVGQSSRPRAKSNGASQGRTTDSLTPLAGKAPSRKNGSGRTTRGIPTSSSSDQGITVEAWEEDAQVIFKAHNTTWRFVYVVVEISGDNLDSTAPKQRLLAPRADQIEVGCIKAASDESWTYRWDWTMTFDDPFAVHDDSVQYLLPFDTNKRLYCCQGFNGEFSHQGEMQYAVDWKAKIGTDILAARGGLVTRLRDRSTESGPLPTFKDKANFLSITHDDHTVGEYLHLKASGVLVKLGERVEAGQKVAVSGNTGWSSTPHIHFHVFKSVLYDPSRPDEPKFQTLPIKFALHKWEPRQGEW